MKSIQIIDNMDKSVKQFEARVTVDVIGDSPVDLQQLQEYLTKAVRLSLTEAMPDENLAQVEIHWDGLREINASKESS